MGVVSLDKLDHGDRAIFDDEHESFRDSVGAFLDKEVVPHHDQWETDGVVDRDVWRKAGSQGLLAFQLDEAYGGGGTDDFRFNVVVNEEMTRRGVYGAAYPLFNDMIAPYLQAQATAEQRHRWFPGLCSGELIAAIAMTEPEAGSDLQGIRTTAVADGDDFVLTGQKTFISNGILADLVIVVARTDPDAGHQGISLLVVERGMEGFERGRNLDKIGQHAQDTAELFFDHVRVPRANLLGAEGSGFGQLMTNLSQERLSIAVSAATACEVVLAECLAYVKERTAFGRPIGAFQHNRFVLAEMATEAHIARVFVDDCITRHLRGGLDTATASMAKWWTTELQKRVVDQGVQLFGGYGYMREYPIARAFVNSRVQTIYGGTTEIQKEIIGRSLGL
jgi:alkylation response protein AidB-like acyl-CoA dehydrogenase